MNQTEKEFLQNYDPNDFDTPLLTIDICIFSIIDERVSVLLQKRNAHPHKDKWSLVGGFVDLKKDKTLELCAERKLYEKTGIQHLYLEQVKTLGCAKRDPRGWSATTLYYALTHPDLNNNDSCEWFFVDEVDMTDIAFDHAALIFESVNRLRSKALYTALPVKLLSPLFTLNELQTVFEIILHSTLPTKSFRRRFESVNAVIPTEQSKVSGKRPAKLFRAADDVENILFPRSLKY